MNSEKMAKGLEGELILSQPKIIKGYLARYAKLVTSAKTGAVFKEDDAT